MIQGTHDILLIDLSRAELFHLAPKCTFVHGAKNAQLLS